MRQGGSDGGSLTVTFANQDRGVVHNLAIYRDPQTMSGTFVVR